MRITITLRASDPPEGEMAADDGVPVTFEGWMGLLSVLSERVSAGSGAPVGQTADELEA